MIGHSTAAELVKLRGLPPVLATVLGTVVAAVGLGAVVAASAPLAADPVQVTVRVIPYLQIGTVLLGVLAVATEYAGRQIRPSLTAVPNRAVLLAGKAVAALVVTVVTGVAAVAAGFAAAWLTLAVRDAPPAPVDGRPIAGAAVYLVLIGLLGFAVTVLLRALVPSLVTMLGVVLVASPLLSAATEVARYLPDRAGGLLYLPDADAVLTPVTGTLVLLGWITAVGAAATVAFLRRDA
jgi:ABC-2 type transport system permease protein